MPISIGAAPQAGFDEPLQLLQDCHRRIERFLEVLQRVVAAATDGALDPAHRAALETALRYFREAAPQHTRDEEESLFPRLRRQGGAEAHAALRDIESLKSDHVRAAALHDLVEMTGQRWLRAGRLPASAHRDLQRWLEELRDLYHSHIAIEDGRIFPLAGKVLAPDALADVGREMRARRARPAARDTARYAWHTAPEPSHPHVPPAPG